MATATAPEVLVFMPNGDVTLKLMRHVVSRPAALAKSKTKAPSKAAEPVLDEDAEIEAALGIELDPPNDDDSVVYYAPDAPGAEDGPFYPPTPRARGSDASRRDRSASPPASFWAALKRQAALLNVDAVAIENDDDAVSENPEPEEADAAEATTEENIVTSHEVHCIVSSRHLMLSSRYFEAVLGGEFKEGKMLRAMGHVDMHFLEDDLDSMLILLNIIHGASRKVPRNLSTEDLSKLAMLVSKFGMLEAVDFFSDTWIDHLQREGLPKSYSREVLKMLYVFWVFDREREFGDMTRLAQREADETIEEDVKRLAIPRGIVDAITSARVSAISSAVAMVHGLVTKYMDGADHCDAAIDDDLRYACDAMVLGSLLKTSRKIGIWPMPEAPFLGKKWRELAKKIRGIKVLDVCNKTSSRRWNSHGPSGNAHGIEDEIEEALKGIEKGLDGLKLKDFSSKSEDCIPVYVPEVQKPDVPLAVVAAPVPPVVDVPSNDVLEPQTNSVKAPHSNGYRPQKEHVDEAESTECEEFHEASSPSEHFVSTGNTTPMDDKNRNDSSPTSKSSSTIDHTPEQRAPCSNGHGFQKDHPDAEPTEYQKFHLPSAPSSPIASNKRPAPIQHMHHDDASAASESTPAIDNRRERASSPPSPSPSRERKFEPSKLQLSQGPQQNRGRSPPRTISREETPRPEMQKAARNSSPSLFSWPKHERRDASTTDTTVMPKSQQSSGFLQQEIQARDSSPRNILHEGSTRKPVPAENPQQIRRSNGHAASTANSQTHSSTHPSSTNGFLHSQAKSSLRNSTYEAVLPKRASMSPPTRSPQTSPKEEALPTGPQSSRHGSSLSYFPPPQQQEAQGHRNSQSSLRTGSHETSISTPKATMTAPLSQNNLYSSQTPTATQSTRRADNTPLPPSPREEGHTARDSAMSKLMAAEKHISRTSQPRPANGTSGGVREDVKSPTPPVARVISIDDAASIEGVSLPTPDWMSAAPPANHHHTATSSNHHHRHEERNGKSPARIPTQIHHPTPTHTHALQEERNGNGNGKPAGQTLIPTERERDRDRDRERERERDRRAQHVIADRKSPSPPAVAVAMAAVNKGREPREVTGGRESPLKQMMTSGDEDDEAEGVDVWSPPKEGFRVRKGGKKIFTNRFS